MTEKLRYLTARQPGVFSYYGHSYEIEPITPPRVNTRNILVVSYPLDQKICKDNPDTMQNVFFDARRLPGFPRPLDRPPQELPEGSRLMLLRGGGIGDVIMLTPALRYIKKTAGSRITVKLSTFTERIPIMDGLGCIDAFFPHPIRLHDLLQEADYYMDFGDPKRIFNDTDMIDFHLDSLFVDPATIPSEEKGPAISEYLRSSEAVIRRIESLGLGRRTKVLFAGKASHRIRHLPPSILELLTWRYPDLAFVIPSDHTGHDGEARNVYRVDTTGGLADFVTAIDRCDLVVSSDSSAYHIAAAVGTPALVFFGPIGSAIRITHYPKVVSLDSAYEGLTCRAPCGISALLETPPTIGIGATGVKELVAGTEITTFTGRTFRFDPDRGCPESNANESPHSPCMGSFSEEEILNAFERTLSLAGNHRKD